MNIQSGTYLITGVTGFVGSLLTKYLIKHTLYIEGKLRIIGVVRDVTKAERILEGFDCFNVEFIQLDLADKLDLCELVKEPVDYMIHCAAATASSYMISKPVETADGIVVGTRKILELAMQKEVKSMVYLSSMEVYGEVKDTGALRKEDELGEVPLNKVRSCYPLAKRLAEHYCYSFYVEYGLPVKIARLAQTFGEGVSPEDTRVFMQFAKAAVEGKDIVLKTAGMSMGNYCESMDAINAIFTILFEGADGEVYNVVNEDNTMRIREMAQLVAERIAEGKIQVVYEIADAAKTGYAPDTGLRLSGEKLRGLGWKPTKNLEQMYRDIIALLTK